MQKKMLSWGLLALALTSFTPTLQAQKMEPRSVKPAGKLPDWANHQSLIITLDSSTTPPQIFASLKSDALYNMIISGGKLTSLYVNGKLIPQDSFYRYDGLVKHIIEQMEKDSLQVVRDQEQAEKDEQQATRDQGQALRDKKQAEQDARQVMLDKVQVERDQQHALSIKRKAEQDARQARLSKVQVEKDMQQALRDKQQAEEDAVRTLRDKKQAEIDMKQALRDKQTAEEDRALLKSLLAEVVKAGLAPDEKSIVSLILDGSVFFVNGQQQSDALQKRFKEKFIKKEGYSFYIHNKVMKVGRDQ